MTVCIGAAHEYTAAKSRPSGRKVNTGHNPTAKPNRGGVCVCVCSGVGWA